MSAPRHARRGGFDQSQTFNYAPPGRLMGDEVSLVTQRSVVRGTGGGHRLLVSGAYPNVFDPRNAVQPRQAHNHPQAAHVQSDSDDEQEVEYPRAHEKSNKIRNQDYSSMRGSSVQEEAMDDIEQQGSGDVLDLDDFTVSDDGGVAPRPSLPSSSESLTSSRSKNAPRKRTSGRSSNSKQSKIIKAKQTLPVKNDSRARNMAQKKILEAFNHKHIRKVVAAFRRCSDRCHCHAPPAGSQASLIVGGPHCQLSKRLDMCINEAKIVSKKLKKLRPTRPNGKTFGNTAWHNGTGFYLNLPHAFIVRRFIALDTEYTDPMFPACMRWLKRAYKKRDKGFNRVDVDKELGRLKEDDVWGLDDDDSHGEESEDSDESSDEESDDTERGGSGDDSDESSEDDEGETSENEEP